MSGLFITLEGGEGAGKTTLVQKLYDELTNRGYQVVKTREPGGSRLSEHIREWLLRRDKEIKVGLNAELLLFLAARVQHLEEQILPALEFGHIVLCDRYHDSSIAYQGKARGLGMDYVEKMCTIASDNLWPDLTLYLDLSPEVGLSRTQVDGKYILDSIESEAIHFHQQVQEGFHIQAKKNPERIHSIDAHVSPEEVFHHAMQKVEQTLPQLLKDEF